jgi:hypothetical protein
MRPWPRYLLLVVLPLVAVVAGLDAAVILTPP